LEEKKNDTKQEL